MGKSKKSRLVTDKSTDYCFEYLANESKLNEQLGGKSTRSERKHDSPIKLSDVDEESESSESEKDTDNWKFDDASSTSSESSSKSLCSPYGKKVTSEKKRATETAPPMAAGAPVPTPQPQFIPPPVIQYSKSPEEIRALKKTNLAILEDLEKKGCILSKRFSMDDSYSEMEDEIKFQKMKRHKENQMVWVNNSFLNIIYGIEFVNQKYDPFNFSLQDWHVQVRSDIDSYHDVFEELIAKYSGDGGNWPPEIRLILMVVSSAFFYGMALKMTSSEGFQKAITEDPNLVKRAKEGMKFDKPNKKPPPGAPSNENVMNLIHQKNRADKPPEGNPNDDRIRELQETIKKNEEKHREELNKVLELNRERHMQEIESLKKQADYERVQTETKPAPEVIGGNNMAPRFEMAEIDTLSASIKKSELDSDNIIQFETFTESKKGKNNSLARNSIKRKSPGSLKPGGKPGRPRVIRLD